MIRDMIAKAGGVFALKAPAVGNPLHAMGRVSGLGRFGIDAGLSQEQYTHNQGYVYAIIRTIANRIVGQPVFHARKVRHDDRPNKARRVLKQFVPDFLKADSAQLEVIPSSAILDAFTRPNEIMTRYAMLFNTVASLELTGRAFWWLRRNEYNRPEIWPLPVHWMQPVHTTKLFGKWTVRPGGGVKDFDLEGREVCYFYYPDPADPLASLSPLTALARSVMADESLEESQRRTFLNSLTPGLAITVGQSAEDSPTGQPTSPTLTRAQRKALKTILKDEYRGVVNTGEPMILDGFIKDIKPIFPGAREMDYLNSGRATQGRLAKGWGVNPISMGEIENANRASSAVADDHLVNNVVNPRITLFSEIMTRWLPPFFTGNADEVVYIQPAASKDIDYELSRDTAMVDRGAKSRNEWRADHGMAPIIGGDNAYIPGQNGGQSGEGTGTGSGDSTDPLSALLGDDEQGGDGSQPSGWVPIVVDRDGDGKPDAGEKRVKVRDDEGHDHGSDGRFTGTGGGGGSSGGSGSGRSAQIHGGVDDRDEEHASKARGFMDKIRDASRKAVAIAKGLGEVAKHLAIEASWAAMTMNLAEDICDTSNDYAKIINAKNTGDWLSENLGVSGNLAAKVSSLVLNYGLTKLKQFIAKKRRESDGGEGKMYDLFPYLEFKADDDEGKLSSMPVKKRAKIVHKIVVGLVGAMGCPKDELPSRGDIVRFMREREEREEEEEAGDDDKAALPFGSVSAGLGLKATAKQLRNLVDEHRKEVAEAVRGALGALGSKAMAEINNYRGQGADSAVSHAINPEKWAETLSDAVGASLIHAARAGASVEWVLTQDKAAARMLRKSGLPARIVRAVSGIVSKLLSAETWKRLAKRIASAVGSVMRRAVRDGSDPATAAASVLTEPVAVASVAEQVADVEAAAAVNGGRHATFSVLKDSGKVIGRRWMTCRDVRVRETHRRAHGQVAFGEKPFNVGGEEAMYPCDPSLSPGNRCRCRCVAITITE